MVDFAASVLAIFLNILQMLTHLIFLELEILLSIVHPILFVDLLEHVIILNISGLVKLIFVISLRRRWNNIFKALFVSLFIGVDV